MGTMLLALAIGIALSAAAGFRVFLPALGLSLAARLEWVTLSPDFAWTASTPALIALGTATVLEVLAYYVPWLDNALDTIASPASVLAGILLTASLLTDMPPVARWAIAIIAGGGVAGTVQGATVLARLKSLGLTGGLANPVVASFELAGAVVVTALALFAPVAGILAVFVFCLLVFGLARRYTTRRKSLST